MLYYRLARARPFFRYTTLAVAAVVTLNGIVLTFLNIFQCRPIENAFNNANDYALKCLDVVNLYVAAAPVNVVTDIAILVLPLPMVTAMHLDVPQKTGLVATFITGLFVTVVDVVRIAYLHELLKEEFDSVNTTKPLIGNIIGSIPSLSWYASYSVMWSAVEVNVGLICACALGIKPLLVRIISGKLRMNSHTCQRLNAITIGTSPTSTSQIDGFARKCSRHNSGEEDDGSFRHTSHRASPTNVHYMYAVDEHQEMDICEFMAANDALVEHARPVETSHHQGHQFTAPSILPPVGLVQPSECPTSQEPMTFKDFVSLGDRKPLTELTKKEAWWPIVFGESVRRLWEGRTG